MRWRNGVRDAYGIEAGRDHGLEVTRHLIAVVKLVAVRAGCERSIRCSARIQLFYADLQELALNGGARRAWTWRRRRPWRNWSDHSSELLGHRSVPRPTATDAWRLTPSETSSSLSPRSITAQRSSPAPRLGRS